jgi:hypothetical protein
MALEAQKAQGGFFGTFPGKWLRPAQHVLLCDQEPPIENHPSIRAEWDQKINFVHL